MFAAFSQALRTIGLTAGVRTFGWGLGAGILGLGIYDNISRPDNQTVTGITGSQLIWIGGVIAAIVWLSER